MTAPRLPDDLLRRLAMMKPEPSLLTTGRAAAKGTGLDYITPPRLTQAYMRLKAGYVPPMPDAVVDDVTATPLTNALTAWIQSRLPQPQSSLSPILSLLGLTEPPK